MFSLLGAALLLSGCAYLPFGGSPGLDADAAALGRRADVRMLRSPQSGAVLLASAAHGGRVLESAFAADESGIGWFDRDRARAISAVGAEVGGEDSGQLVFLRARPGPAVPGPCVLVRSSDTDAVFRREVELSDGARRVARLRLERRVSILGDSAELNQALGSVVPVRLRTAGFRADTTLTNLGDAPWSDASAPALRGVSAWRASSGLRIVVPVGDDPRLDAVPLGAGAPLASDRVRISGRVLFFRGDGRVAGPVGVTPRDAPAVLGAWDERREVLSVVRFSAGEGERDGAAVVLGGRGAACEVATHSPRCELAPGASVSYRRTTIHLTGPRRDLDVVARNVLGVGLDEIEAALP